MSNVKDAQVIKPLDEVFEGRSVIGESIVGPGQKFNIFERVEYPKTGGIYIYYRGLPFPRKGFPYPEAILANDILKKNIVMMIDIFGRKDMILPIIGFAITPWKIKLRVLENAIQRFSSIADWLMRGHYLKYERHSPAAQEVYTFIKTFTQSLGFTEIAAIWFAKIGATIIEYDDAYRYRLEDIASEVGIVEIYKRPGKEIKRLAKIVSERELSHAKSTFTSLARIISPLFLIPKIRKAFKTALRHTNFKRMGLDEADRYHVLLRDDYNFFGKTFDQRVETYKEFHKDGKYPPMIEVKG